MPKIFTKAHALDALISCAVVLACLGTIGYLEADEADRQAAYEKHLADVDAQVAREQREALLQRLQKQGEAMTFPISAYQKPQPRRNE